jgi:D-arabinan exo alpha-(1,3)/(1,5)-arabinofuranosidase (non-reducing end)
MNGASVAGISRLSSARTRSISPENPTGAPGAGGMATDGTGAAAARDLGRGWKVSPSIEIPAGGTAVLGEIDGPGTIRHLWLTTHPNHWRSLVLRATWDGAEAPAVEVPVGDFFCSGWGEFAQVSSVPVAVNPNGGFNAYWEMPFRRSARLTLENLGTEPAVVYFQIDYELAPVGDDAAYLHTQWHRSNPLPRKETHPILTGVTGAGHYVGTYLAWGVNSSGWWGEGEVKFYVDGDEEFPTVCGTGTEDYFGGAWNFDVPGQGYTAYSTPYLGLPQIIRPDGLYRSQQRFGMYRWHLPDPIRFQRDLHVTVQALGWRSGGRYLPLSDDIASTAWWYQAEPAGTPGDDMTADALEVC